jgi:DICT domain-containing protein
LVLGYGLDPHQEPRYQVLPLARDRDIGNEWIVMVINPHYAAAFVARDCGDDGPDGDRRLDFIFTHNRDAVIAAARCYLQETGSWLRSS